METIGERIYRRMRELDFIQKELAKKSNITESNISRYINGLTEPKSAVTKRIANTLHVSTDYLLGYEKKIEKDIKVILEKVAKILKEDNLTYNGKIASKETIDAALMTINMGILYTNDINKDTVTE
ncbi:MULTISPECIES: helix-turn-helix domain-containing protein [unclassified Romboutsia]|uniref:helix-turn-helix domain-containing protein n=1 Tax=unclassified Romboutsia TaxID=2626894 RepID=UPI000821E08B|nr:MULTISPECIES: helix-turn-helix transcriptional regulator [unclassified Romboutsia]SCH01507.1 HTH-type transcriptional regulator immR [uncultured Clostridium sp.]